MPAYLLGKKQFPRQLPPYIGAGDKTEAVEYAIQAKIYWATTLGALAWLAGRAGTTQ